MFDLDRLCMGCMGDNDGQEVCPICGFDKNAPTPPHALELKTVLQERYIVGKMLIYGGDGITYLGFDKLGEKIVRIKEYYPGSVCQRKDGVGVRVKKESAFSYNSGIMDFLELSEKLETLTDANGIYPVMNVFEENGTAYRITQHTHGINLRDFLLRNGGTLSWEQAKPLFMPLIQTIINLHKAGIIHRAISPETIIVGRDGKLRLIDFSISSVRTTKGDLAPQLYAGYAAIEQYGHAKTTDGEWTDVYGLAATMFKALIGNPPAEATQRIENDNMSFPKRLAEEIPHNVLIALANALQIMPEDRTSSIAEFRADLSDDDEELPPVVAKATKSRDKKSSAKKEEKDSKPKFKKTDKMMAIKAGAITVGALLVVALIVVFAFFGDSIFSKPSNDDITSIASLTSVETVSIASNTVSHSEKLYEVPDLTGKYFADIETNVAYKGIFTYKVGSKQYSDTVAKGKIISQTPAKGSNVTKDTEIQVVISLGPEQVNIPYTIKNKSKIDAYIALLELGIEPTAIEFIETTEGDTIEGGCVVKTQPEMGTKVGRDSKIIVFIKKATVIDNSDTQEEQTEQ